MAQHATMSIQCFLPMLSIVMILGCDTQTVTTQVMVTETTDSAETAEPTSTFTSTIDPCELVQPSEGTTPVPTLSLEVLSKTTLPGGPVDNEVFAMPPGAGLPNHRFEGRLELHDEHLAEIDNHFTEWWLPDGQDESVLPQFDYPLVQCGNTLLPARRGRILTEDSYWDLLLHPGRVWTIPHDMGMTRASLPFALTMKAENCVQNGALTFLFDDDSVSDVRWQVTQETCHFHSFDMWGQSRATYHREPVEEADEIRQAYVTQRTHHFPTRPWEDLKEEYGVDLNQLDSELTLDNLTTRGLWVDGTLYMDRCRTRYGDFPYCDEVVLPSFSLAKTSFISMTMMTAAQEFDSGVYDITLAELLPNETEAGAGDWSAVTMGHLVDMTTGHYRWATQDDDYMGDFYSQYDLDSRLASAYLFPYQEPPGERVVYLTPNSQIAAAALNVYLERMGAVPSDAYDYLVDRVFNPIGLSPEYTTTLRTHEDGGQNNGTAFGGYGMTLTPQGTALLGRFLLEGGQLDGEQLLHPERLEAALFRTEDRGAPMDYYDWFYLGGMWGNTADLSCEPTIPYMFGVSGITVALFPNGVVYFSYTDSQHYPVRSVVEQVNKIDPLCD